MTILNIYF